MFVYTMSKKRAFRMALIILAVFVGIVIGIASILTAINTGAEEKKLPIYSVERGDNKISLTFDCAWGNSNTDELLKILADAEAKATFFVTGEFCDKYPDDIRKFVDSGHEIANHSDMHPHIKGMNINDFIQDTKECNRKIKMITGTNPTLYRAPYGEYDNNTIQTINGMNMSFIQWSADSIDWQEPDAATITKRILDNTRSGSILLFHNDLANTTEALPDLLIKLKQQGFEFVKVSDLIYTENYKIDHAGKQIPIVKTMISDSSIDSLDEAFEILRDNLTLEEISSLKNGITPQIAIRVSQILSTEQIQAISALSTEEYSAAWNHLSAAAGFDYGNGEADEIYYEEEDAEYEEYNDEVEVEIEEDTEEDTAYDSEYIVPFDGQVDELQEYGIEYGIDNVLDYYNDISKGENINTDTIGNDEAITTENDVATIANNTDAIITDNADEVVAENVEAVIADNVDAIIDENADTVIVDNTDTIITDNVDDVIVENDVATITGNENLTLIEDK